MKTIEDEEGSSPTPTAVPCHSDQDQAASNEVEEDGEKTDKTESGSSQSISTVNTVSSNGPIVNFSMPTLTKRSVTLQMLLAAGILKPGEGTMSLEYHGQKFLGDLLDNGQIRSQETSQIFTSPSAWAIACKQIINPEKILRKSGCGWASIKYRGLKLDYYKTVWFKRLREGSIDIKNISNGASSSDDSDDDDPPHCVLKFGEHFDNSPGYQSAQTLGAKILISCTEFKEMERLQPFHVKIAAEALALADFHCNITNTETVGYISGHWNGDQNCLKMEVIHPCRVLMPHSSSIDCDNERNRVALDIQKLNHEVVGWYHSHPKALPQPSKDDISRQLDYQIMMKGASESSYIPCVGVIISPLSYSNKEDSKKSAVQFFWVMPPPENRPMEMGRPMHIEYDTFSESNFDPKKILEKLGALINFYKEKKEVIDLHDLTPGRMEKLQDTFSTWLPEVKGNEEFWKEVRHLFLSPLPPPTAAKPPPQPLSPLASTSKCTPASNSTPSSSAAASTSDATDSALTPSTLPTEDLME